MSKQTSREAYAVTRTEHECSVLTLLPFLIGSSGTEITMLNTIDTHEAILVGVSCFTPTTPVIEGPRLLTISQISPICVGGLHEESKEPNCLERFTQRRSSASTGHVDFIRGRLRHPAMANPYLQRKAQRLRG